MTTVFGLRQDLFLSQFRGCKRYAVVTETQLQSPAFLIDGIATIRRVVWDIPDRQCSDHFMDKLRDLDGYFVNPDGTEYHFNDALFEERRDFWRWTIQTPEPRPEALRLRKENRAFVKEILSIQAACNPYEALFWGWRR